MRLASRIALAVFLAATTSAAQWRLARIVPIENYPTLARQAWISGEVQVRCVLDQSGAVAEVTPVSGHPLLAIAAVENAKQWRFQPVGTGTPEKSEITLTYVFRFTEPGTRENPKATFNLDGPNHIAVTAPLACSDNSPCTLPKPATQQSDDALSGPFKLSKQDAIQNGDYRLEKAYDEIEQGWTARLSRDGKLLGVFSIGGEGAFEKHHIRLGFFPLFKNENREQLIVRIWSGGAHCCDTYWIADLLPEFRILYRSANYNLNAMLGADDLDGDGNVEFWQENRTFDYFCASFADSPSVNAYFKYDRKARYYLPANGRFPEHALKDSASWTAKLKAINTKEQLSYDDLPENVDAARYRQLVLNVALPLIYAGRADEGWAFFDKEYRLPDRTEIKQRVTDRLKGDRFYSAVRR